jgi:hypothetical protein
VNLAASGKIVLRKAPAIRKVFSQALATAKKGNYILDSREGVMYY